MTPNSPNPLPHATNCVVPQDKITQYLLNPGHPDGGSKAKFFLAHGYSIAQWNRLAEDLRLHGQAHPVKGVPRPADGGETYAIVGPMTLLDGSVRTVRTIWYIETNGTTPSLVTAYPTR